MSFYINHFLVDLDVCSGVQDYCAAVRHLAVFPPEFPCVLPHPCFHQLCLTPLGSGWRALQILCHKEKVTNFSFIWPHVLYDHSTFFHIFAGFFMIFLINWMPDSFCFQMIDNAPGDVQSLDIVLQPKSAFKHYISLSSLVFIILFSE